jgi:hypothetical protein
MYTLFISCADGTPAFYPEGSYATLEEAVTAADNRAEAYVEHPTIGGTSIVYRVLVPE